ncbi:MAG: DUF2283 domain-containing protein [Candidatus Vecturithrix sp.]|jgi:uncharacterized protein YuzE|nr:DUF2283 domain-containing protein [Candidatus Vecturithrix sp.]
MATQLIDNPMIRTCVGVSSLLTRLKKPHIWIDYDQEADVLYLSFRKPQKAKKTIEFDEDTLIRTDGREIVGITIMNASVRESLNIMEDIQ